MRRLAVLALACTALVACGDDEPESAGSPREAFIAEVDAFCKDVNDEGRALNLRIERTARSAVAAGSSERAVIKEVAPLLREGHEVQRRYVRRFLDFDSPAGDEDVVGRMREIVEDQTTVFGRVVRAAEAGDLSKYARLNTELQTIAKLRKDLFQGYGFKSCGGGTTAPGGSQQ